MDINQLIKEVASVRKEKKEWSNDIKDILLMAQAELGELAESYLVNHTSYNKSSDRKPDSVESEMGDVLHMIFALCHELNIDPEKALNKTHKKVLKGKKLN